MADSIDRPGGISGIRSTERIKAADPAPKANARREQDTDFSFEDKVDVHAPPAEQPALEEIDLSVAMIRAVIAGELAPETLQALMDFAPLGDLSSALPLCDVLEASRQEFVTWPRTLTLAQALVRAAS